MIAFLFAGQGSQSIGMGRELYEGNAAARAVLDACQAARPGLLELMFSGDKAAIDTTINTQPAVFAVDMAAAAALGAYGVKPDMVAGFSLGEIAALDYAGVFNASDGFSFVQARAKYMQEAAPPGSGAMAAIIKLTAEQVKECCTGQVWPVNYNCPGQTVIAGRPEAVAAASQAASAAGGRAMPLPVSGAFHTPLMAEVRKKLRAELEKLTLSEPRIPVYGNTLAVPYDSNIAERIAAQVFNPVLWESSIRAMAEAGADVFIELGPGRTLSGFVKRILPEAVITNVENINSLESTLALLRERGILV